MAPFPPFFQSSWGIPPSSPFEKVNISGNLVPHFFKYSPLLGFPGNFLLFPRNRPLNLSLSTVGCLLVNHSNKKIYNVNAFTKIFHLSHYKLILIEKMMCQYFVLVRSQKILTFLGRGLWDWMRYLSHVCSSSHSRGTTGSLEFPGNMQLRYKRGLLKIK